MLIQSPNPGSSRAARGRHPSTLREFYVHSVLVAKHFTANGKFTRLDGADFNVNGALAILLKINGLIDLARCCNRSVKQPFQ